MSDQIRCTICRKPVRPGRRVVFQADGQLTHVTCLASIRKPLTRLVPKRAPDPTCGACSKPISPGQSIIKGEAGLLQVDCFLDQRSITGGSDLPAWSPTGDDLDLMTPNGHRSFIAACAATRLTSSVLRTRAAAAVARGRLLRAG